MLETTPKALTAAVVESSELSASDKGHMFELYTTYYVGADASVFHTDLHNKNYSVILRDEQGIIQGFSTLAVYEAIYDHKPLRVIFSGDTIVDKAYWGQNPFAKTWLEYTGKLMAQTPDIPLYWLLIVKGHRTYRYLSLFSQNYYPRHDRETPPDIQKLMHHLSLQRFGSAYNPDNGLVYFPEPRSYLRDDLAQIPQKDLKRPEVQFFLSKNPNYKHGDELVCLCRLEPDNLTRFARKWFLDGAKQVVQTNQTTAFLTSAM